MPSLMATSPSSSSSQHRLLHRPSSTSMMLSACEDEDEDTDSSSSPSSLPDAAAEILPLEMANSADYHQHYYRHHRHPHQQSPAAGDSESGSIPSANSLLPLLSSYFSTASRTCHDRLCLNTSTDTDDICTICTTAAASAASATTVHQKQKPKQQWTIVDRRKQHSAAAVSSCCPLHSATSSPFSSLSSFFSPLSRCQRHLYYHFHHHRTHHFPYRQCCRHLHHHQHHRRREQQPPSSAFCLPVTSPSTSTTSIPPFTSSRQSTYSPAFSPFHSIAQNHPLMPTKSTSSLSSSRSSQPKSSSPPLSSSSLLPFYRLLLCLVTLLVLIVSNHRVASDRNRFLHISALCLRERVHPLYQKIDGAVISSKSEKNLDCTITFQTDTILQKFMLRFEKLALDCNDHLYIYDGAHTHGNHKAHLSCRSTRAEVGTIYTQGNFLTLHYTTDAYSKADNGFRLIITAYKDSKNYCREHRCSNQFCISGDLVCDHVNHCGDNSDETYYANCPEIEEADTIIGLDPNFFIALVVLVFVLCLACVLSVSFCLCRRERLLQRQQQRISLQQQYGGGQMGPGAGGQLMVDPSTGQMMVGVGAMGIGNHTGATPILQHNNNSYNSKLDGCTMITSLDGYGATRNGGLVNSFTHTTLPNNHLAGANFATLPHLHNHNHIANSQQQQQMHQQQTAAVSVATSGTGQAHVRFGTLPVRGAAGGNNEKPPPPAYPSNYFNGAGQQGGAGAGGGGIPMMPVNGGPNAAAAAVMHNGNGILANGGGSNGGIVNIHTPPHSANAAAANQVQTQVIYTAK